MGATAANEGPPAPVFIGLLASYALAATLLCCGVLGLLTSWSVGESVGGVTTLLGLLVLGATYVAWRGSRMGRTFIGLLTAIITVAGVVYIFKGPNSAIIPSIVVASISAGTFVLLFLPAGSKRFYAAA